MSKAFVLIITVFVLCSCKKSWLDAKPDKNLAVPKTLQDFQALLDNDASLMNVNSTALGEVASDGHFMINPTYLQTLAGELNAYTWTDSLKTIEIKDWIQSYSRVFTCNVVLGGLAKLHPSSASEQLTLNNIKGQALFQRARCFLELSQLWAPPYEKATASSQLGIPLRLESDITIPTQRSTVEKDYSQILNDLLEAKDLLPNFPLVRTRGSKQSVFALLARTYLFMKDYESSGKYADSCLKLSSDLIDYNTLPISSSFVGVFNKEVIFQNRMPVYYSLHPSFLRIDPNLYALYDNNDLRKKIFFKLNSNNTVSWKGNYDNTASVIWSGIATDEILLIRAEAYARTNNISAALTDLNTLLQKRWVTNTYVPYSSSNADDVLNKIIIERKKELLLRGLRWSDLRRLNTDTRFATTIARAIGTNNYTLEPNSYKYTLPIPTDIIQQTGIQQNPGWPY